MNDHATEVRNAINTSGLIFDDALNYLGEVRTRCYVREMARGQRRGQAFFNVLHPDDQNKLVGTPADPFHSDERVDVVYALIYLLEH